MRPEARNPMTEAKKVRSSSPLSRSSLYLRASVRKLDLPRQRSPARIIRFRHERTPAMREQRVPNMCLRRLDASAHHAQATRAHSMNLDRWKCGRIDVRMDRMEAVMKRLDPITAILLLLAGLLSLALTVLAFVVQVPLRDGSHNLVRAASGAYAEVPVAPQTYFQKYGISELLLLGFGLLSVVAVGVALRISAARGTNGAGRPAWRLSVACLILGVVGSVTIAPYLLMVGILLVLACGTVSRSRMAGDSDGSEVVAIRTVGTL